MSRGGARIRTTFYYFLLEGGHVGRFATAQSGVEPCGLRIGGLSKLEAQNLEDQIKGRKDLCPSLIRRIAYIVMLSLARLFHRSTLSFQKVVCEVTTQPVAVFQRID